MTTDDFIHTARMEAVRRYVTVGGNTAMEGARAGAFAAGAKWARTHLDAQDEAAIRALATTTTHTGQDIVEAARIMRAVAQEPTDAEVEAAAIMIARDVSYGADPDLSGYRIVARAALSAAHAARRDEEKR